MKNWKRLVSLASMLVVTTSLFAGCGSKKEGSEQAAAPQKEIELKFPSFWVGKDSKASMMTEIINKFNEDNKGKIKVTVEEIADYNAYEDKMKTSIATNSVPDIFLFKTGAMAEPYYKSGKLMDLTKYMNDGWKDSFVKNALNDATYDGKVMAVPYEYGTASVYYNKKLLAQAGVTELPKTYKEFFDVCEKLKAKGINPMSQMTGDNAWTSMLWYSQLVVAIGGQDVYKRGLDDPAFLEAAKVMQQMYKYTTKDAVGATAAVSGGHFLNERTAIFINGPWYIGTIKKQGINNLYDNIVVAPAPAYEGGKGQAGGYIGYTQTNIGAAKQTDKAKEEAVIKFLKTLTDQANVKKLSASAGSMFDIKVDNGTDTERVQAAISDQVNKAPYIVPHFQLMVKPAAGSEFPQALSGLVSGNKTPEQFIKQLKDKNQ